MRQAINDAKQQLSALPHWVKVMMWTQVMMLALALGFLVEMFSTERDQFVALFNVAASLLNAHPNPSAQTELRNALTIGISGRIWTYGMVFTIFLSIACGSLLVSLTSWKKDKPKLI